MATIFRDTFNRKNNEIVGSASGPGSTWNETPQTNGTCSIENKTLKFNVTASGADVNIYQTASGAKPKYMKIVMKVTTNNVGCFFYPTQTVGIPFFFGISNPTTISINNITYGSVSLDTWITFEVKNINWNQTTADFYVDGVLKQSSGWWDTAYKSITDWRLNVGSNGTGVAYVDEILASDKESDVISGVVRVSLSSPTSFTFGGVNGGKWLEDFRVSTEQYVDWINRGNS